MSCDGITLCNAGPGEYAFGSSLGEQKASSMTSAPVAGFGSSTREHWAIVSTPGKQPSAAAKGSEVPGPGAYPAPQLLGKTVASTTRSAPGFYFGTSERGDD